MGIAIGTEGANIKKSKQIKGVLSVNTNRTKRGGNSFTVVGEVENGIFISVYMFGPLNIWNWVILNLTLNLFTTCLESIKFNSHLCREMLIQLVSSIYV